MCQDLDRGPLTHKFANRCQAVIQGEVHFTKHGSLWVIPPVKGVLRIYTKSKLEFC